MSSLGGSLSDLVVVDLSRMLAGPYCTMLLADQGAEVIKVEGPEGDPARTLGPFLEGADESGFGAYFQSVNRNKKSIILDLKSDEGSSALKALVAKADILVENFRPGVMERLGLSFESLQKINRRLVYASISGFGDPRTGESPYHQWPAYDVIAQAAGGLISVTGPDAETPVRVGPSLGDMVPGMFAAIGILSATHHARRTGQGQFVDVSMYDGVLAICDRLLYRYTYGDHISLPEGNDHPLVRPFGIFSAKDGLIALAAPEKKSWKELCVTMGRTDLLTDSRFIDAKNRLANGAILNEIIAGWTAGHERHVLAKLLGGKVAFFPVHNAADICEDPHVAARRMLVEVAHGKGNARPKIVNTPIKMTHTPGGIFTGAPMLGEHQESVAKRFGVNLPVKEGIVS